MGAYYENYLTVNVAMLAVTPMNDKGYFSRSTCQGLPKAIIDKADIVILEVNEALPWMCGGEESYVHISEADVVVEAGSYPLLEMKAPRPSETEVRIAQNLLPFIKNGATVQLGIGGVPNASASLSRTAILRISACTRSLPRTLPRHVQGGQKLTNRCKTLHPGKSVAAIAMGTRDFYDWIDHNDEFLGLPLSLCQRPACAGEEQQHDLHQRLPER